MNPTRIVLAALFATALVLASAPTVTAADPPDVCVYEKGVGECGGALVMVCVDDQLLCLWASYQCVVGPCDPVPP